MIDILCKDIFKQFKINRVVETGTDKGETVAEVSRWFSEIDPDFGRIKEHKVTGSRSFHFGNGLIQYPVFIDSRSGRCQIHSVDIDRYSFETAQEHFKSNPNIYLYHSSSEQFLRILLSREIDDQKLNNNYLFCLDAHWGKYWPLRDELKIIQKLKKYLIVIDDFMVPGKSNPSFPHGPFGFDIYKGQILNWAYICDLFTAVKVRIFYPKRPNRDGRGWVLLTHGYTDSELRFLESLELFEMDQSDEKHTAWVKPTWRSHWDLKNIIREVLPISLLRSMHRVYEKIV